MTTAHAARGTTTAKTRTTSHRRRDSRSSHSRPRCTPPVLEHASQTTALESEYHRRHSHAHRSCCDAPAVERGCFWTARDTGGHGSVVYWTPQSASRAGFFRKDPRQVS